jgi:hypothetical protein
VALRAMLLDPARRTRLGSSGREHAWLGRAATMVDGYARLYEKLLFEARRGGA